MANKKKGIINKRLFSPKNNYNKEKYNKVITNKKLKNPLSLVPRVKVFVPRSRLDVIKIGNKPWQRKRNTTIPRFNFLRFLFRKRYFVEADVTDNHLKLPISIKDWHLIRVSFLEMGKKIFMFKTKEKFLSALALRRKSNFPVMSYLTQIIYQVEIRQSIILLRVGYVPTLELANHLIRLKYVLFNEIRNSGNRLAMVSLSCMCVLSKLVVQTLFLFKPYRDAYFLYKKAVTRFIRFGFYRKRFIVSRYRYFRYFPRKTQNLQYEPKYKGLIPVIMFKNRRKGIINKKVRKFE